MPGIPATRLSGGRVRAWINASEGAAVEALTIDGRPALSRTPWADRVTPGPEPAPSEADWVARWRGGWQLCFPSTGHPEPGAEAPQGFHGAASQAPWTVVRLADDRMHLRWQDGWGLRAERTWRLTSDGIEAVTSAVNEGAAPRRIAVAEHLVLGGDVLAPLSAGATLALEVPADTMLAPLDYDGLPAGDAVAWPGEPRERWHAIDAATPARVAALVGGAETPRLRRVTVHGPHVEASVAWSGLPHALLWEELAASQAAPWNGAVIALGIEPTTTPHGAGTGLDHGIVTLQPGARLDSADRARGALGDGMTAAPLRTVVTGAANGIGLAVADRLRARGDRVVGLDREPGPDVLLVDLAVAEDRERAITQAIERLGGIDVLVNVAGIFRSGSVADSGLDDWREVWSVNLDAPLDLMHRVAPGMAAQDFGRIVNITSVHARSAQPRCLAYDVAKAGLEAATRSAALDLASGGVLVNAVAPGFVRTRMSLNEEGVDETDTDAFRARYVEAGKLPLGRAARPEEIAAPVDWLSGRDNTYVTGQVVTADGGLTMTF